MNLNIATTQTLVAWANNLLQQNTFEAYRQLVQKLGAIAQNNSTQFGFYAPELRSISSSLCRLEVYRPLQTIDFQQVIQEIIFETVHVELVQTGDFWWGVVEGTKSGNRNEIGDFYAFKYKGHDGKSKTVCDYLAHSIPFGAFAPAEIYDVSDLRASRQHLATPSRLPLPTNILEVHLPTATIGGTLADLQEFYQGIFSKQAHNQLLTSLEENFIAYDAIELMPLQPNIEQEGKPNFWQKTTRDGNKMTVSLRQPNIQNWGYDIVIAASSAVNPNLLRSKRPHELLDFIETLHAAPRPIQVILDIVYGHADNQALALLAKPFFAGAGMYGQELAYQQPTVRAILLETQQRIANYGIDGFRVDASHDIRGWDVKNNCPDYDANYLALMNDISVTTKEGIEYQPFMIFEDGRPWPEQGFALNSTYEEVNKNIANAAQWGPLTFANSNPHVSTFWLQKHWRVQEIAQKGSRWITGSTNHDSLRVGAQVNPYEQAINTFFGKDFGSIIRRGFHSPATKLLEYFLPGIPMDFIQANCYTPWGFLRNTDEQFGVKIVAEETFFVDWWFQKGDFEHPAFFKALKKIGFKSSTQLADFQHDLHKVIELTDYNLEQVIQILKTTNKKKYPLFESVTALKRFAFVWMEEMHEWCNVVHHAPKIDAAMTSFHAKTRAFRLENPWLRNNLNAEQGDLLTFKAAEGAVLYTCKRGDFLFVGNMEGKKITLNSNDFSDYQLVLQTPKGNLEALENGEAVLLRRKE
ncbi:MAG: hypothetical protein RLZZ292_1988 [Bacteroidota bacterium]|jgi:hypothetical protein